jgi:hypothetical protein
MCLEKNIDSGANEAHDSSYRSRTHGQTLVLISNRVIISGICSLTARRDRLILADYKLIIRCEYGTATCTGDRFRYCTAQREGFSLWTNLDYGRLYDCEGTEPSPTLLQKHPTAFTNGLKSRRFMLSSTIAKITVRNLPSNWLRSVSTNILEMLHGSQPKAPQPHAPRMISV